MKQPSETSVGVAAAAEEQPELDMREELVRHADQILELMGRIEALEKEIHKDTSTIWMENQVEVAPDE